MTLSVSMQRILARTGDGSPTLYVPELNEHYHSIHGAIQESLFVYIDKVLRQIDKPEIRLFETGFGTGLNAFLSCREAEKEKRIICYHSIELYPLSKPEWLEFAKYLKESETDKSFFERIHECTWEKEEQITRFFRLKKIKADLTTYRSPETYDAIFFDAFGPDVQAELWTPEIFRNISEMMNPGAILSTYSSKGQVRRNMQAAGLLVSRIPGPKGKRQILLATKP